MSDQLGGDAGNVSATARPIGLTGFAQYGSHGAEA